MKDMISKLLGSKGLRSAALMSVGNVSATVVSAIAMIIFSRTLGPEQFGVFSVLFSLLLILSKVGDFGINTAVQRFIAQHKDENQSIQSFVRVGYSLKLMITLSIAIFGLIFGSWVTTHWLNLDLIYAPSVKLVFGFSIGVIFYEYVTTVLQGVHSFGLSILSNWVQSLLKLVFGVVTYFTQLTSILFLTLLYTLSPIFGSLVGFARLPIGYFVPQWDKSVARRILSVSKWTGIAILSATIADNLDVLIVQNMLTSYETGLYSAAVRIASVASLVAWSLGTVMNVRVASYHDKVHLHSYLKKAVLLAISSFVGISLLFLVSTPLITLTVGSSYLEAVTPLNFLFLSTGLLAATSPFVALFYLFDKPAYFAYSGILGTILLLATDLLFIPNLGLLGATYARIIARFGVLVFTILYARYAYKQEFSTK